MNNYFGSNLKWLRSLKKLKQQDIAKMLGKSDATVCAWEKGTRSPLVEDVFLLSRYFEIDMERLYFTDLIAEALSEK